VPATIKSRCQQFSFRLIPIEMITGILKKTCAELGMEAEDEALFWIAKESTGSLRDAYTLFDQVASFSEGNIRAGLIREKLGLVGLDQLNALAEACAANDTQAAFTLVDQLLDSGVAIEQFVIDLAGYYRSLLLLKNGVTRESLLGYTADRFSQKPLAALDPIHLERALDLLLTLYRDIRYSVSPRFELETAVSKLSWLSRWVSPPELRAAIAGARESLGLPVNADAATSAQPAFPREELEARFQAYDTAPKRETASTNREPIQSAVPDYTSDGGADREVHDRAIILEKPGTLTEEFKRHLAARESAQAAEKNGGRGENAPELPPEAETVRRIFNGTVIKYK
jgi:DNA polymerase-3 subunit gamma/tau